MAKSIMDRDTFLDSEYQSMHPLLSWRSVVAGLVIAGFFMIGLMGLGMAFGGIGMEDGTSAKSAGLFSGIWFLASALISLFVGSYFAARISKFQSGRVGSAQGLVIAALFLGMFLYQTISAIGGIGSLTGSLLGKTAGMVGTGVEKMSDSPMVKNMVEDNMGDLNLRSDPQDVATGIAGRVIRGDTEGAKNYLAREAGIPPEEADRRIAAAKTKIDQSLDQARNVAATGLKSAGWSLFLLVVLGGISGVLGGSLGSVANFKKPLANREFREQRV
ncbi:MAG: hypothetical protein H0V66_02600 [Bdellovibrionales bacterium]|nr:hypothetical protein [Bdellovibrionales bacterium]